MNLEELLIELAKSFNRETMYFPIKINGTHNWEYLERNCIKVDFVSKEIIIDTTDSPKEENK